MALHKATKPATAAAERELRDSDLGRIDSKAKDFHALGQAARRIEDIRIGKRHRRDHGDISRLAQSIKELGLLQPVVVTPDGNLVAGERRIKAAAHLGWAEVPVHVVDIDSIVSGELAENTYRKDFTPSEIVDIAETVKLRECELAQQRMTLGKISPGSVAGRTLDKIARPFGISGKTLEHAEAVVAAARAEPDKFGDLVPDMDRTGFVNGVYRQLKIRRQAEQIRSEPPPLPGRGPYRVIVADPPWLYHKSDETSSAQGIGPFPRLTVDQICALNVGSLAAPDCVLWLWTTNTHMRAAFAVLDAWGFEHKTILTWDKERMGIGKWLRAQTEHVLMTVRGKPTIALTNQRTILYERARKHSEKPLRFYEMVEKLCPAPRYAYLFSRYQHNDKWDCHGDEAPKPCEVES